MKKIFILLLMIIPLFLSAQNSQETSSLENEEPHLKETGYIRGTHVNLRDSASFESKPKSIRLGYNTKVAILDTSIVQSNHEWALIKKGCYLVTSKEKAYLEKNRCVKIIRKETNGTYIVISDPSGNKVKGRINEDCLSFIDEQTWYKIKVVNADIEEINGWIFSLLLNH